MHTSYEHITYLHQFLCVDLRFYQKQLRQSLCLGPYLDIHDRSKQLSMERLVDCSCSR